MQVFVAASLQRERDRPGVSVSTCILEDRGNFTPIGFVLVCDACFDKKERLVNVCGWLALWIRLKANVIVHSFVSFRDNKR